MVIVASFACIVAVGVSTASDVVKDTVTVSPIFAYSESELLDEISIGFALFNTCLTSKVSTEREPIVSFPALSINFVFIFKRALSTNPGTFSKKSALVIVLIESTKSLLVIV